MAITNLENIAQLNGTYDGDELESLSTVLVTRLVDGITVTKSADRDIWSNGELTYTVVVNNTTEIPILTAQFIDELDTTLINLVQDSVYVEGVQTTYVYAGGVLTVDLGTVDATSTKTIVFKVVRV